ncbi:non-ribosomal peptide synthetase, partial [Andreprevotia chitinilytica]|uniref:non-ribosomal peptide synthetase n=1 Tax=Andreprevotia chitinilytica TaxID=396808 RepID=UPI000551EAC7
MGSNTDTSTLEQLRRALKLKMLKESNEAKRPETKTSIAPADRSQPLPLSWSQQRLWFIEQLDANASAAYHMPAALQLTGQLDRPALCRALDRLVARHESLRTTFARVDGEPVQVIAPADAGLALQEQDLRQLSAAARTAEVQQALANTASQPFDLAHGPLIRGQLLRLADDDHLLLITQHHIISDGWSIGVLVREVSALYAAFQQGQADPLPPLTIQYADYAVWQRQWLQGEVLQTQRTFWRDHLLGAPALLELPTDRPRPPTQSYRGSALALTLPPALTAGLKQLSQRHGATLFMTLLAGWSVLLSRWSGQDDVVIGTPVANRPRSELEGLMGFFVNTLALRVRLDGNPSVQTVLAQTKASTLAAYGHQDLPFEQVVDALQPPRSLSHSPLFQTLFALNNTPHGKALGLPGLTLQAIDPPRNTTQFDLSLTLHEDGATLSGQLQYATDLFDAQTIERLAGHFETLLAGMVANDQQSVGQLPLLSAVERQQVLHDFNATPASAHFQTDALIHQLFEAQAAQQPDAIALTCEDQTLSYGALNARANQLAHHLIALGVRPDDRVALCLDRGVDLLVGLLGILKAGGAYVPLDPNYPAERLAYMLSDSQPVALVTQAGLLEALPAIDVPVVALDSASGLADQPASNPVVANLTAERLAYVIYTSGSTGQPKGVMVEHGNVQRLFATTAERFAFGPTDVWTLFHSIAFDFSVWEVWGALIYGGRLVIVPSLCARSPQAFHELLCREQVTVLNQTPSAFRQLLVAQAAAPMPHALRRIIFGGEALELHALAPWFAHNDPAQTELVNMYGITEITVHATWRVITPADVAAGQGSVVGPALPDLRAYVLDAYRQPVPVGVTGELYIGGAGVARGYLNRPELTAERFIADPFHTDAKARLYKTGDLGRWLPNGQIEYLGRNDFQVKIRGFRIELGEIEAQLTACAGVREAVVIAREDQPGDQRLVAYLIPQDDIELSAGDLRQQLSESLADYMLPSAFITLETFPLTPNGKLDRKALPAPDQSAVVSRAYEAPQGEVEQAITTIWQDLLGLERVGRHDHFFELGGHSLMVVALIERLRQHSLVADVRAVFSAPTVAGLAAAVTAGEGSDAQADFIVPPNRIPADCTILTPDLLPLVNLSQTELDSIIAAVPQGVANVQDIYPLSPTQEGMLFYHQLAEKGDAYLMRSTLAFDDRAELDGFLAALQTVIDRHDILRTSFHWQGLSRSVQVVQRHAPLPIEWLTLSPEQPVLPQLLERTDPRQLRLDLTRAPLLAAYIAQDPHSDEWLLALLDHHLISDNYTLQLILAEIRALRDVATAALPPQLPYRNFIARLGAVSPAAHEAYFRARLSDVSEPTAPFGLIDTQGDGDQVNQAHRVIAAEAARRIRRGAQQQGVTAAVLFHIAYAQVLAQCSGRDDVVFGTVLSGRLQGGAEQALGVFINTLPIRIPLLADARQLARATQQDLSELLLHEQAPLTQAQRCSAVPSALPLFNALLNYRHPLLVAGDNMAQLTGMRLLKSEERTNYPLVLAIDDQGQEFILTSQCRDEIDAGRFADYVVTAVTSLVDALEQADPRPVARFGILSAAERQQVQVDFNATAVDYPAEALIHQLFEAQAAAQPDAIALVCEDQTLSYGELNARANQLAHHLIGLGIQPDDRVAICAERSLDMVVGMLGILKAGGAYVPLDPSYPAERVAYMLSDSQPVALLTHSALREVLPTLNVPVVALDDAAVLAQQPSHNPVVPGLTSPHLAYVIYTSGSTGQPKGVMVEHRNVLRLVIHSAYAPISAKDCVAHCANPAFDASTWEIWSALLNGARLVVIPQAVLLDPNLFRAVLQATAVNVLHLTIGLFNQYADALSSVFTQLDYLLFGGEQSDLRTVARVLRDSPPRQLVHCYGPTETTTFATTYQIKTLAEGLRSVPIGKPISNTQIHVLDAHGQPVPIGVAGEIYIGGAGVARGYLNRPDLTAERFVADPFSSDVSARLYK